MGRQPASEAGNFITVVSGLPRSGTSMMMQMLHAGGVSCLTDELREADADNPRGYFECEKVKQLRKDNSWLAEARGKVVKIIAQLLEFLPPEFNYKIIFMDRDVNEVLSSQTKMLERQGSTGGNLSDERLHEIFSQQLDRIRDRLVAENIPTLYVKHKDALERPTAVAEQIKNFLGEDLDLQAMVGVVDPDLYRQRRD